jgi:hypothetical protein
MSQSLEPYLRVAVGVSAALATLGCLCPPCGPDPATVEKVAPGSRLVLWDGDDAKGHNAQGWADCDSKPECQSKFAVAPKEGMNGSTALRFHGEGPGWIGGGWNLFGWWPENAGYDISQYDALTFTIRTKASEPSLNVDPGSVGVGMRCSNGKKDSSSAKILPHAHRYSDGSWHQVVIPVRELRKGRQGKAFDLHTVWELVFFTWSESKRNFDVYLDDIAVEKKK